MNTRARQGFLLAAVSLLLIGQALGYTFIESGAAWQPGSVPMQIKLGTGANPLQDGTNFSSSVQEAMTAWNTSLGTVQFAPTIVAESSTTDADHTVNEVVFGDTIDGEAFGPNVLAVTLSYSARSIHQLVQSDIFFNTAYTWDSYRGNLRFDTANKLIPDIRRVGLHELGHVLGLDHPNEAGQSVTAMMNSSIGNLDALASDDIAGAQNLYRAAGDTTPPANDNFANATPVNLNNNAALVTGSSYYATKQTGEPNHAGNTGGRSVWWKWTASGSGILTISTQGSYFDSVLAVYTGTAVTSLTRLVSNDDASTNPHVQYSAVTFATTGGSTYYIAVDGWDAENGFVTLGLTYGFAPTITGQPSSRAVPVGQPVTFSVTASGAPLPSFQWRKNGVNLSGATDNSYTISAVTLDSAGSYTVVATNSLGSVTSNPALLTVIGSAAADFNADGKPDLIWSNSKTGERALWLMNGTNFLASSTLGFFPLEWTIAATGDFNADGKPDIVWSNSITGERALWLMNGTNLLASSTLGIFPLEWTVAATADFNADSKPDLIWSNSITGERAIWLMSGTNFLASSTLGIFPREWTVAATADFNADGKPDIIWSNSITGERAIWLMNGTNFLASSTLGIFPLEWTVAGTADFNTDGKPDIIWSNSITGERALWLMNGTNFLGSSTLGLFPLEWTVKN